MKKLDIAGILSVILLSAMVSFPGCAANEAGKAGGVVRQDFVDEKIGRMSAEERFMLHGIGPMPASLVEDAYKMYIKDKGEQIICASDEQLAQRIMNAKDNVSIISFQRLLGRDKELALTCLTKKIKEICNSRQISEESAGMQIAKYGPKVIEPLLELAHGSVGRRTYIVIDAFGFLGDPQEIDKLFDIFGDFSRLDEVSYLRLAHAAVMAGHPRGMEMLINAATLEHNYCISCRADIKKITRGYDDLPENWAKEDWDSWWQKHRDCLRPGNTHLKAVSPVFIASVHKVLKAAADKIEKEASTQ